MANEGMQHVEHVATLFRLTREALALNTTQLALLLGVDRSGLTRIDSHKRYGEGRNGSMQVTPFAWRVADALRYPKHVIETLASGEINGEPITTEMIQQIVDAHMALWRDELLREWARVQLPRYTAKQIRGMAMSELLTIASDLDAAYYNNVPIYNVTRAVQGLVARRIIAELAKRDLLIRNG